MNTLPPPDLAVIDTAIELIRNDEEHFTCWALGSALEVHGLWTRPLQDLYVEQYRRSCRDKGARLPSWWNSPLSCKRPRLAALRSFRQACIDAALIKP